MKIIFFIGAIFFLIISSCGRLVVNEEKPVAEEYINIETNSVFTTEETVEVSNKLKVLILPFDNKSDQKAYPNSKIVNTILQNEIYPFLYIIPSFDVPDKTNLAALNSDLLNRQDLNTQEIYSNYQADIIIFGDYDLHGISTNTTAQIHLKIWKKSSGKTLAQEYKTPIDPDIFDATDAMLSQIIKFTLNGELKIAYLNIGNLKIGNGSYSLAINNKPVAKITNDNFSLNLKILPNAVYSVRLRNLADKRNVINTTLMLKPSDTTNISYAALGNIRCSITNRAPGEDFQLFLNGNEIPLDSVISNLPAERDYQVKVVDKNKNEYSNTFYLSDGEFKKYILPKNRMVLYDYIGIYAIPFNSYNNYNSSVKIDSYKDYKDGKKCCTWAFNVAFLTGSDSGWAGIRFNFGRKEMDWAEFNTLKIWVYGMKTYTSYFIQLVNNRNNRYKHWIIDDWKGWKQLSIPINLLKFKKIDYPLKSLEFGMNSSAYGLEGRLSSYGNFKFSIGGMEVTRE